MKVILASGSPRRLELLRQIGLNPVVMISHAREISEAGTPREVVRENALRKGMNVLPLCTPDDLVIAADTVVAVDGDVLGKPKDAADASRMLHRLSGRSHLVHTGLFVGCKGHSVVSVTTTEVVFFPLSDELIKWYIASGEPMDKAGAYGIQGRAALFIPTIEGSYSNVVGLPFAALFSALNELEVTLNEALFDQGNGTGGKAS
jgi:septum formation protein